MLPLVGAWAGGKATPGVTAPSRARAPIDPAVCDIDVVSPHPGGAEAAKGGGVHPLKGIVRWVQNAARQFGYNCRKCWPPEGKVRLVRKERRAGASSLRAVRKGQAR